MYGLLIESIMDHVRKRFGDEAWENIRQRAGIPHTCFSTHETYSEQLIPKIADAAAQVTGLPEDELMDEFGVAFVSFVGQYGYDSILKVLGRHMRDFLNGLDNLHEYLRFSYPKLRPPSFFVENENKNGLTLHYRSRRRGFVHYVKGQIRRVGELFYNTRVDIFVVGQHFNKDDNTTHVTFRLLFDNVAFKDARKVNEDSVVDNIPLRSELLFELFPFHVVFSRSMEIRSVGSALAAVIPDAVGRKLTEMFFLARPITQFTWEEVLAHTNNVFELVSMKVVKKDGQLETEKPKKEEKPHSDSGSEKDSHNLLSLSQESVRDFDDDHVRLHVKGQMMFMSEWDSIMFLGTPIMKSLDDMFSSGLYINDLSMHDSSRDLVLAGTQQSAELKLALDQEQEKSRLLEESMKKLDSEMRRTDALLYQMIPKPVADRLRRGEPSVSTCEVFESVTILFSDVVGFTTICSRITPMEVVSMLNAMYTEFDKLSEKHDVYKVETIGDAYMAVAGAPTVTRFHALSMCNMALDMLDAMHQLKDPSTPQDSMKIRVGIHTGTAVAGVVGIKMPRYCLFGDTVNTASRMETNGEAMKIHISETTKEELRQYPYKVQYRGEIEVKGKGSMKTYWLTGRDDDPSHQPGCPFVQLMEQERQQHMRERRDSDAAAANMCPHRPVYSPVSFDDLHADTATPRTSPIAAVPGSPSRGAASLGDGDSRKGSKASGSLAHGGAGGDHSRLLASPAAGGVTPQPMAPSIVTAYSSAAMVKPTQAVPPQLTLETASQKPQPAPAVGDPHGEASAAKPVPQHLNHVHKHKVSAGLQGLHHKQHLTALPGLPTTTMTFAASTPPAAHPTNCNSNVVLNNNDKSQAAGSQGREHIYPIKDVDTGKGPMNGARRANVVIRPAAKAQPETISLGRKPDHPEKARSKTCSIV